MHDDEFCGQQKSDDDFQPRARRALGMATSSAAQAMVDVPHL